VRGNRLPKPDARHLIRSSSASPSVFGGSETIVFRGTAASVADVGRVVWDMLHLWCQAGLVVGSMLLGE
jgi:hypothetical protein